MGAYCKRLFGNKVRIGDADVLEFLYENIVLHDIGHRAEGKLDGHIDTSGGEVIIEDGHLDDPELTVTVDYGTAKAAFVDRDPQAVMQAFFAGKILVEGDVSRLMALQAEQPNDAAIEMYQRLSAMTAED